MKSGFTSYARSFVKFSPYNEHINKASWLLINVTCKGYLKQWLEQANLSAIGLSI